MISYLRLGFFVSAQNRRVDAARKDAARVTARVGQEQLQQKARLAFEAVGPGAVRIPFNLVAEIYAKW